LFNTAKLWNYSNNSSIKWSDYLDYERENDYIKGNEKFSRYWMKDGKAVLRYTPLMRNRDNNGNGYIDAEEIRWYIASVEQLYGLYIGDQGLSPDAQLYHPKRKAYKRDEVYEEGPLAGRRKYMEHVISSTQRGSGDKPYSPTVIWVEEGVSTSYYRQEFKWDNNNHGAQSIRCVRNLGLPNPTKDNILNESANTPEKLIEVIFPSGQVGKNSEIIFDLTRINPKSLRSYPTTHELEPTDETDEMSRPYRKFKTGNLISTGSYDNLYNQILIGNSPITDTGYRVPNVREAALMMLYCNGKGNWWDNTNIHSISYYSRGSKCEDESMIAKNNPTWVFGNNQYATMGDASSTYTRAVSDIPIE
jgi:hypothetical protein